MTYLRVASALTLCTLAACAAKDSNLNQNVPPELTGVVGTFRAELSPSLKNEENYFTIGEDSVTATKVCNPGDHAVTVEVTASARISDGHFDVATPAEIADGACVVRIDAGVTAFEVQDDQLLLTPEGQSTFVYGHRRGDAAGDRLKAASAATRDAAVSAKEGAQQAITGLKDTVVNGSAAVIDQTAKSATELKNAALNQATRATDTVVHGAAVVKDATLETAAAAKDQAVAGATAVKDSTIEGARALREEAERDAAATKTFVRNGLTRINEAAGSAVAGARDVAVGLTASVRDALISFYDRIRGALGAGLDKTGDSLKRAGSDVKPKRD